MRTQIEAMAATQGHTQSLHTNALDEALALPTPFSARIARNTQLFLIEESGTTRIIDPWGGSYYVERLTAELAARAQSHIDEIEALGGMAKAIEQGLPKRRIEEAAARTQARIDSGRQTVIGVNAFAPTVERDLNVLKVDAAAVRAMQIEKLKRLRAERDEAATHSALEALTNGARGKANLLQLSVEAARAKATVGEISLAMERAFGRHVAEIRAISGVYLAESGPAAEANRRVIELTRAFAENEGHPPRILVAKMGQDGHDRGQKIIASAFADLGFDVKIGPLFATPEEVAAQAAESKAHIVGVSSLAAGHLALVPALKSALRGVGMGETMIVVGGVIPGAGFRAASRRGRGCDLSARHDHRGGRPEPDRATERATRLQPACAGVADECRNPSLLLGMPCVARYPILTRENALRRVTTLRRLRQIGTIPGRRCGATFALSCQGLHRRGSEMRHARLGC